MNKLIMVRFGEIGTKGKNKNDFIKTLRQNIVESLKGIKSKKIEYAHDRTYIYVDDYEFDITMNIIAKIPGIQNFSEVIKCDKNIDDLKIVSLQIVKNLSGTFKIKCSRSDKKFELTSDKIINLIAGNILANTGLKVDIHNPDYFLQIEVRLQGIFIYLDKKAGLGGYPLGTLGKAMVMLSGGIDSPVAAYMMIRRGIRIELIHFASPPYTSQLALEKIIDIAKVLTDYQPSIRLFIVNFTKIQEAIKDLKMESYMITIMRRMMYRITQQLASKKRCLMIASGESIGQVASQTSESINVISRVLSIPHIRPLAVVDKMQIVKIAQDINTLEISNRPHIDCCTIFTPINPATKPKIDVIEKLESLFDYQSLIEEAISNLEVVQVVKEA